VPLETILSQVQGEIARAGANAKEQVKLPLAVVVPNIPPELLQIEGQQTQEIDPNFVESPFAEGGKAAPKTPQIDAPPPPATASPAPSAAPAAPVPPAPPPGPSATIVMLPGGKSVPPAPAPVPASAAPPQVPPPPPHLMVPPPPAPVPPPPATPSAPKTSVRVESPGPAVSGPAPTSVRLYLATFLKRLPEEVLNAPREQLVDQAGERIVELPIELILPQLATGRVSLDYAALHPHLPAEMLVPVNSANKAHSVALPLERIVPQIPADMLGVVAGQMVQLPEDTDIPKELFTDKRAGEAPAAEKPAPASRPAGPAAPAPAEALPEIPADKLRPVETRDLEITPTPAVWDEDKALERVNRFQLHELVEINGIPLAQARKLVDQREKGALDAAALKELGIRRKSILRLLGMPEPSGAVNVSVLNRLLSLTEQRTLKVQEIIDTAVSKFGIEAGMMVAEDGLVLAGKPPEGVDKQMISAFLPQIYRHLARGLAPAGTGAISRITILLEKRVVSLFRAAGVFLLFWHSREKMSKEFFKRVERLTEELSRQNLSAAQA
jgi:predicted regulator of Ras-like GTPase activity (Roadblock/LC7/MglB family)